MSTTADFAPTAGQPQERHPRGLYVLFLTEMWERFGFYTAAAIMTLFLQDTVQGFGWTKTQATSLWSNYLMFVYLTPFLGGLFADRVLGYRPSIVIGGVVFMAGYFLLSLGSPASFYAALALIFVGNGFFKPNISTMVGNLYPAGSPLKDAAYNIFYMGINVGAFLAPITAEVLRQRIGFRAAFFAAGLGMGIGTVMFLAFYRYLGAAEQPKKQRTPQDVELAEDLPPEARAVSYSPLGGAWEGEAPAEPAQSAPSRAGSAGASPSQGERYGPACVAARSALEQVPEWRRIGALLVVYAIVIVFWMVFHQNGSTMTYWANDNTDWHASRVTPLLIELFTLGLIDGSDVSGVISAAINPFWIIVLSMPLVRFWRWMNARGWEPSTPAKMALGMVLTCVAFLILYAGGRAGGDTGRVSPWWLISAYGVLSLGELLLSPMGLSLVSKVAPARMRGLMMGGWFVATAIGNKLTMIGVYWVKWKHSTFWLVLALAALFMAGVLLVLLKPLKRAMPDV